MPQIIGGHRTAPAPSVPAPSLEPRVADITSSLTRREWDELTDIVMRRMERTMADELARRGRRAMPRGM